MSDAPPPPAPPPPAAPPPVPQPNRGPDVGGAISWAFSAFGKNAGTMIALAAVIMVAGLLGWGVQRGLDPLINRFVYGCQNITTEADLNACLAKGGAGMFAAFAGGLVLQVVIFILTLLAEIGLINASLKVTRGEKPSFGDIWHPKHGWLYLGVSIVVGIGIGFGFVLCILPGLVLIWLWQFVQYAALDKGYGHSFSSGVRAVMNYKGLSIVTLLVVLVAEIIQVFTCGIGALVIAPFVCLFMANMYRQFLGEPVAPAS